MIRVNHLSKKFNGNVVLDDISFEIERGEIFVILGESGTGKSVLLKHLVGLFKPDRGEVFIDGQNITGLSEKALLKVRKNMGYLFQEGALYDFMNAFDNIAFPLKEHTRLSLKEIKEKVKNILKVVDLEGIEEKFPSELSGGMKKRVALARSIILDSKIICCDEPTSGLDPIRSRDISNLIKDVARNFHCTAVVTSHDIPNSFRIADRLGLINQGRLVACGKPEDLKKSMDNFVREFING